MVAQSQVQDWDQGEGSCHRSWVPWRSLHGWAQAAASGPPALRGGSSAVEAARHGAQEARCRVLVQHRGMEGAQARWMTTSGTDVSSGQLPSGMCAEPKAAPAPRGSVTSLGTASSGVVNQAATGGKSLPGVEQEKSSQLPLRLLGSHVWPRPCAA